MWLQLKYELLGERRVVIQSQTDPMQFLPEAMTHTAPKLERTNPSSDTMHS